MEFPRKHRTSVLTIALLALAASPATPAQSAVRDRILATVDEEPVTWADLHRMVKYRGFSWPEKAEELDSFYRELVDQLINQALIVRETDRTPFIDVSPEELQRFFSTWTRRFSSEEGREDWLRWQTLTELEIRGMMRRQIIVNKFIELRFEPFVIVLPDDILSYYNEEFRPELERDQLPVPDVSVVEENIRQILTVRRTTQQLEGWLETAKARVRIHELLFRDPPDRPNLPAELLDQLKPTLEPFSKAPSSNR